MFDLFRFNFFCSTLVFLATWKSHLKQCFCKKVILSVKLNLGVLFVTQYGIHSRIHCIPIFRIIMVCREFTDCCIKPVGVTSIVTYRYISNN